jgi:hypothetical protein
MRRKRNDTTKAGTDCATELLSVAWPRQVTTHMLTVVDLECDLWIIDNDSLWKQTTWYDPPLRESNEMIM